MRFLSWVFVIFVMTLQLDSVFGYVAEDQILSLPGWSGKTLPSRQFSGYLNAAMGDKHLHYWFVESETDPVNAPVVVWYNGGPGCSSLDGFFYEHGPWVLSDDGKTLSVREYRWSRLANMLYIEAPAGVGFSYSDSKSYQHTDESSAFDNRDAIENFFEKFPEYKKNPFYISGESYAGIYVPMLARAILMAEDAGTYTGAKLLGIGVGNGCTGTEVGVCGFYNSNLCRGLYLQMEYILNLAFTNPDLKVAVAQACEWDKCIEPTAKINVLSNQCMKLLDEVSFELGDINTYNVYGKCSFNSCDGPSGNAVVTRVGPAKQMKQQRRLSTYDPNFDATNQVTKQKSSKISHLHSSSVVDTTDDDENFEKFFDYGPAGCIDSYAATTYLTNPEVQKAIHVHALDYCWAVCNQAKGFRYSSTQSNLPRDVYPTLISRLRVLIFNGDWDACVPYTDNQLWTESMGFDTIKPWHPWAYTDDKNTTQIGGYSVKYNVSSLGLGSFEFRTIRGKKYTPFYYFLLFNFILCIFSYCCYRCGTHGSH